MSGKVAIVTGSNKGIGYAIVRELLLRGVETVYLTARSSDRGNQAVEKLKEEGLTPLFYQLDVTDRDNVKEFAEHVKQKHGGIDILINNAGVLPKTKSNYDNTKNVIDTNFESVLVIQKFLFPILKDNARVINISSDCGHISNLKNQTWIERLTNEDLTIDDIRAFINWYLESVRKGTLKNEDFAQTTILPYRISKIALCALTRLQQKEIERGISINSVHPGFVKTDMTQGLGYLTIEEAAKTPVYLALDIDQSAKGKYFWFDKSEKDWTDSTLQLFFNVDDHKEMMESSGQNDFKDKVQPVSAN